MENFQETSNFIWQIADEILRDDFKRGKYPDVILPFTVLRRLDCVLAPTKELVLQRYETLTAKGLQNLDGQLKKAADKSFYNILSIVPLNSSTGCKYRKLLKRLFAEYAGSGG